MSPSAIFSRDADLKNFNIMSSGGKFSCARVPDECLYHTVIQGNNLYNGPKTEQLQLHVLRKSQFPHSPYLYCTSGDFNATPESYIDFPAYLPAVSHNPSGSTLSKASTFSTGDWDHSMVEIIYDYDFGDADGRRVRLFFVKPRWKKTSSNLVLDFRSSSEATLFLRHLLGVISHQSSGEISCLEFEPKSFRLGITGQKYPPHEGMRDGKSSAEFFRDVNERRRMYFSGDEGRTFSGWIHGHPFTPSKPSMDILISVKVCIVGRRVYAHKFTETADDVQQTLYIPKFKVNVESEMDVYYQDTTEMSTEFSRIAAEFLHGQVLVERDVDFSFKTNHGMREDVKKGATLYLVHRSSGDVSFQHLVRPAFWRKSFDDIQGPAHFNQPCSLVVYIVWDKWAQIMDVSQCPVLIDSSDPSSCTIQLQNQPPYPRRVNITEGHSDKFPYWPLDDFLPLDASFPVSKIKFMRREDTEWFIRQKEILRSNVCILCRTRSKRVQRAQLNPDNIHESLKTCLISSLAFVSLIGFDTRDEESSQLIHPFSHTVKQYLSKQRAAIKGRGMDLGIAK